MVQPLQLVATALRKVAVAFYTTKYSLKKKAGWLGQPIIQPYFGYGNKDFVYLKGRLLEDVGLSKPEDNHNKWQNLKAMYKRYTADFIPGARISVEFEGHETEVTTDEEGYFEVNLSLEQPIESDRDWFPMHFKLEDEIIHNQEESTATGRVMISETNSQFGIISDIDDTILVSRATKFLRKIRLLLLKNAYTRLPFEGVAAFYHALQIGNERNCFNPIFYVSSSSWKLYDLLLDFCQMKGIPVGPYMLRESRADDYRFISSIHNDHKLKKIEHILKVYAKIKFILIGDSGQKDTEIYAQVVRDFPGRIENIYIRDVSKEKNDVKITAIAEELKEKYDVKMNLVKHTSEAAELAYSSGYISHKELLNVKGDEEREYQYTEDPEELEKQ